MRACDLTRLGDGKLVQCLESLVEKERVTMSDLLAHVAEVDLRRLYVPAGYPSMFEYCVRELGFSEEVAYKRIQAARAARKFPALFGAVAGGRLHLTAIVLLAPHLTKENARELVESSTRKRKSEIVELLAMRFPRPDVPEVLRELPARASRQLAPAQVGVSSSRPSGHLIPGPTQLDPDPVGPPRPRITPLAPARYALQATLPKESHDMLQRVRELLSHQVPSGDLAQVLAFCLKAGLEKLQKRKFAATDRPRKPNGRITNKRTIPAQVKRAVWRRDDGRCTFGAATGKRCDARRFLEFDHVEPVARGGRSTFQNTRLRCRAHNQYEAECLYGSGFMHKKRERERAQPG
jgi:hypothetical protein